MEENGDLGNLVKMSVDPTGKTYVVSIPSMEDGEKHTRPVVTELAGDFSFRELAAMAGGVFVGHDSVADPESRRNRRGCLFLGPQVLSWPP